MLIRLNGNEGLAAEHGILRAGDVQVLLDAHQARLEAQAQCRALVAQAEEQARQHLAEAQQQVMQFMQQAQQQAQQMVQMAQQSIQDAVEQARVEGERRAAAEWHERHAQQLAAHAQAMAAMNDRLAGVVTMALERLVDAHPRAAFFDRALKQVQGLTRGASSLAVRVHPDDVETADAALARLRHAGTLQVEVSADPGLAPGGCVFESELGVLDASLDVQLDAMRSALERAVRVAAADAAQASADDAPFGPSGDEAIHGETMPADLHDPTHESFDEGFDHEHEFEHQEVHDEDADLDGSHEEQQP